MSQKFRNRFQSACRRADPHHPRRSIGVMHSRPSLTISCSGIITHLPQNLISQRNGKKENLNYKKSGHYVNARAGGADGVSLSFGLRGRYPWSVASLARPTGRNRGGEPLLTVPLNLRDRPNNRRISETLSSNLLPKLGGARLPNGMTVITECVGVKAWFTLLGHYARRAVANHRPRLRLRRSGASPHQVSRELPVDPEPFRWLAPAHLINAGVSRMCAQTGSG